MKKEQGFIEVIAVVLLAILVIGGLWFLLCLRFEPSEQNVSGVVYNNKNNEVLSGNTTFSVRASENTVVTEENKSTYCLPPNSPYIELVNKAAKDKSIKVIVTTKKVFTFVSNPLKCVDNVVVEKQ